MEEKSRVWHQIISSKEFNSLNKEEQDKRFKKVLTDASNMLFPPIMEEVKKLKEKILPGYFYRLNRDNMIFTTTRVGVLSFINSLSVLPCMTISKIEESIYVLVDGDDIPIKDLNVIEEKIFKSK